MNKFWKFLSNLLPKTEADLLRQEVLALDHDDPKNLVKIAHLHQRLHNGYGVLIGRTNDDAWNFFMCELHYKLYEEYREKHINYMQILK